MTDGHLISNTNPQPNQEFVFSFSQNPTRLSDSEFDLFLVQRAKIIRDERTKEWKVTTLSYEYAVVRRSDKQEVIAFHWEGKHGRNPIPHMHIGYAVSENATMLGPKAHIPSGRVLIEDIVSFVITELKVKPLPHRVDNWRTVIAKAREAVMKSKTW